MKYLLMVIITLTLIGTKAQEKMKKDTIPYYEIPDFPEEYSPGGVMARMIDGLGFRFYWASEGLREEDLNYKPSEDARTADETIDHIYSLSRTIYLTTKGEEVTRRGEEDLSFSEKRILTLKMLKDASDILRKDPDLSQLNMVFVGSKGKSEFPYWNLINGPIADAIWHCGQLVSFRRASGNPFDSNASLLRGKYRG